MLRKTFFLILILSHTLQNIVANEDEGPEDILTKLNGAPSAIVNGSVHAITGRYCDTTVDIHMKGVSGLTFERSRFGRTLAGWNTNHHSTMIMSVQEPVRASAKCKYKFIYSGAHGQQHIYSKSAKNRYKLPKEITFTEKMADQGVTNLSRGHISGQTNVKNDYIKYDDIKNTGDFITGNGEIHVFNTLETNKEVNLKKITHPNTIQWHYKYTDKNDLCEIKAINGQWGVAGSISFTREYEKKPYKHPPKAYVESSDGQKVTYTVNNVAKKKSERCYTITKVEGSHIPTIDYNFKDCRLIKKWYPNDRFLATEYYSKGTHQNGKELVKVSSKSKCRGRVSYQCGPVGHDQKAIATYRYFYDIDSKKHGKGTTRVYDAYDRLTTYAYNNNRIDTITYHSEDESPEKIEHFYWGSGNNIGNLVCRSIENGDGQPQLCRTFQYDGKGNVLEDRLYGNLTGTNHNPLSIDENGIVNENGIESIVKSFTYANSRFNVVTSEDDGKKRTTYSYKPNTNLVVHKLAWVGDTVIQREFNEYNKFGCMTRTILDDGTSTDRNNLDGVSERHITEYDHNNSAVVGLPSRVTSLVWNPYTGNEEALKTVAYSYTREGWITAEHHLDSLGNTAKSTTYKHDRFGNVIKITDTQGNIITRIYDDNGNKTFEQGSRLDVHKEYLYDFSNRLVAEEEIHKDGLRLKHSYKYDFLGNKIAEVDVYGHETRYTYDRMSRVVSSIGPDGNSLQSVQYNILNQAITRHDAMGAVSNCTYNIRGNLTSLTHPGNTKEQCTYNLDGTLKHKIERDGKSTHYTYDAQGREVTANVFAGNGQLLYQTSKEYNSFHLLKEIDPEGLVTSYEYNYKGKVVKVTTGNRIQEMEYDTLGRRAKLIEKASENDGIITEYAYDVFDRITETTITNLSGDVQSWELCRYDCEGNKIAITKQGQAGLLTTHNEYNARGKITKSIDPEGREHKIFYRYDYINEEGKCVEYREKIDPTGKKVITISDIYGRDKKIILYDPHGKILHATSFGYDQKGNKLEKIDEVYSRGEHTRNFVCKWDYDESDRPIRQVEGYGTVIQKETLITYNEQGKKASVTKPDGIQVFYDYGENGLLENVYSSDQTIHYSYTYDIKGNPLVVDDHIHGTQTKRLYDQHSRVIHEQQGTGISIATEYDPVGRVRAIHHPDGVTIHYAYDGTHLKKITRKDQQGNEIYAHEYLDYDGLGKVTESSLAGDVGKISYQYDILGRVKEIDTQHWKEEISGYDTSGNIIGKKVIDECGDAEDTYQYDLLSQLTSEEGSVSHRYENDSLNNRVSKDGAEHEVNALNQVLSDGNKLYTYDQNGNINSIQHFEKFTYFTYDAFDRLVEVNDDGKVITYRYDEHHRRLSKNHELYLYQDRNEVAAIGDNGTLYQRRVLGVGLGGEIGAAIAVEIDDHLYVPIHDHNGNVTTLIDTENNEVAESYRYSAFGEEINPADESINPWRFSSKRVDEELGFIFFGRRYYMPEVGRWLTADPLGDYDGSNLYAYVKNNPLIQVDIYGLAAQPSAENYRGHQHRWVPIAPVRAMGRGAAWCANQGELLCKHLLPPSPIRYAGEACFQLLQGKPISPPSWRVESHIETVGNKPCPKGIKQVYTPGVLTTIEEALKIAQRISDLSGGYEVTVLCHPTRGLMTDLLYCAFEKCNISNDHVNFCNEKYREMYQTLKQESDHPMIYIHAHSRGGLELDLSTKDLPKEIKQSLHITTYGSATVINQDDFHFAKNYVNKRDLVTRTDAVGMIKNPDSVTFTNYASDSLFWIKDHYIDNPGYESAMEKTINNYTNTERWKI
jgi:RHS repeat-associated protein